MTTIVGATILGPHSEVDFPNEVLGEVLEAAASTVKRGVLRVLQQALVDSNPRTKVSIQQAILCGHSV